MTASSGDLRREAGAGGVRVFSNPSRSTQRPILRRFASQERLGNRVFRMVRSFQQYSIGMDEAPPASPDSRAPALAEDEMVEVWSGSSSSRRRPLVGGFDGLRMNPYTPPTTTTAQSAASSHLQSPPSPPPPKDEDRKGSKNQIRRIKHEANQPKGTISISPIDISNPNSKDSPSGSKDHLAEISANSLKQPPIWDQSNSKLSNSMSNSTPFPPRISSASVSVSASESRIYFPDVRQGIYQPKDFNKRLSRIPSYTEKESKGQDAIISKVELNTPSPQAAPFATYLISRKERKEHPPQSQIPSPIKGRPRTDGFRYATTPILPSQKNENLPTPALSLLRPISPAQTQPRQNIHKSRTFNMLSTLASSFSRSSLTREQSPGSSINGSIPKARTYNSLGTAASTTAVTTFNAISVTPSVSSTTLSDISFPFPQATSEEIFNLQIFAAQSDAYWLGRITSLGDQFRTELIEQTTKSPEILERYTGPTKKKTSKGAKDLEETNQTNADLDSSRDREKGVKNFQNDSEKTLQRALIHLQSLCVTAEARKSLFEFQQKYARRTEAPSLLPKGGHMKDSLITRIVTAVHPENLRNARSSTGTGHRTGFGRFGKSRNEPSIGH